MPRHVVKDLVRCVDVVAVAARQRAVGRATSTLGILILACAAGTALPGSAVASPAPLSAADSSFVHVSADFAPADSGADALSHDPDLVPVGSRATVISLPVLAGTVTVLRTRGLVPRHEYGAHVHAGTCGADSLASGSHYQHIPDPVQPSVDPTYANPRNEIWLDFRADARGNGLAVATVRWQFDHRPAGAVVLHEHLTLRVPGEAGAAGARVGCVSVPFAP